MTTAVNDASPRAFLLCTLPCPPSACTGVAVIWDLCARSVVDAIVFAWTVMFLHAVAGAVIEETAGALTAGFTFCRVTTVTRWVSARSSTLHAELVDACVRTVDEDFWSGTGC